MPGFSGNRYAEIREPLRLLLGYSSTHWILSITLTLPQAGVCEMEFGGTKCFIGQHLGRLEEEQAPGWLGEEEEAGSAEKTLVCLYCKSFKASLNWVEQAEQFLPIRLTKINQNGRTGIPPLVSKVDTASPGKGVV